VVLQTVVASAVTDGRVRVLLEPPDESLRLAKQLCKHAWLAEVRGVSRSVLQAIRQEELSDNAVRALQHSKAHPQFLALDVQQTDSCLTQEETERVPGSSSRRETVRALWPAHGVEVEPASVGPHRDEE